MKWTAETAVHFLFWERKDRENGPISEPVVFCEGYIRRSKMIAVEIENIKRFMAGFLAGDLFDDFLMNEGKLSMDIAYEFNGKVLKEFYDTEEWEEYGVYSMGERKGKDVWSDQRKEDAFVISVCYDAEAGKSGKIS